MIELIQYGYLETPYLSEFPYLQPATEQGVAIQAQFQITPEHLNPLQFIAQMNKEKALGYQFSGLIENDEKVLAIQTELVFTEEKTLAIQSSFEIDGYEKVIGAQSNSQIASENAYGLQFDNTTTNDKVNGLQFSSIPSPQDEVSGFELSSSKSLPHYRCGGYLNEEPYLSQFQYLAPFYCVPLGLQFSVFNTQDKAKGIQQQNSISDEHVSPIQFLGFITKDKTKGIQLNSIREKFLGVQVRSAIYNTTNLRILVDFPSRGVTGTNWTASSTKASSTNSFTVNNLNTDIVEQYWRSDNAVTTATLVCNTQLVQGVFLDTLAILNHNLSGSASVRLQGSNSPTFATTPLDIFLKYEASNIYYIAPTLPNEAYQYFKLTINDPGNADDFLRIGTIVFGSAVIFTDESFIDKVTFGQKQFVDKVFTEGFSNVSNDRGRKKYLNLEFRNLVYGKSNFQSMREIFNYAGTILKCLYIPVPQQASRFAVFGKLNEIPQEQHNYKGAEADYVDFTIEVDESL